MTDVSENEDYDGRVHTKKVWVEVEVQRWPDGSIQLPGGVDVPRARRALRGLLAVCPGVPMLFGEPNSMYEKGDELAPLLSESYTYPAFGKDMGREITGFVRELREALGGLDQ